MAARNQTGLYERNGILHMDKLYLGQRIRGSTFTSDHDEAMLLLAARMQEVRNVSLHGGRVKRTFNDAIDYYLKTKTKRSLTLDKRLIEPLRSWIGKLTLEDVHDETLNPYIKHRLQVDGVRKKTVNLSLAVVRHILHLCATTWKDDKLTWLEKEPKITLLSVNDAAKIYALSYDDQDRFFKKMQSHLSDMALFTVNTGARQNEVCQLRWSWEEEVVGLPAGHEEIIIFRVPGEYTKSGEERLLICNKLAAAVINRRRKNYRDEVFLRRRNNTQDFVFVNPKGHYLRVMNNNPWRRAWEQAGLPVSKKIRRGVHVLRHAYGSRLRNVDVVREDVAYLLGHSRNSEDLTTKYSAPQIMRIYRLTNKICVPCEVAHVRKKNANFMDMVA